MRIVLPQRLLMMRGSILVSQGLIPVRPEPGVPFFSMLQSHGLILGRPGPGVPFFTLREFRPQQAVSRDLGLALREESCEPHAPTRGERALEGRDTHSGAARGGGSGNGTNPPKADSSRSRHFGGTSPAGKVPACPGGRLHTGRLSYTQEELELIAESRRFNEEGKKKRAVVQDLQGRRYTMAGMNREKGDFTVPASFPLCEFLRSGFKPRWIREPDFDDPSDSVHGWFVEEERTGTLVHPNSVPVRPGDTLGMFPGGMTLIFDARSDDSIQSDAARLAELRPGSLAELEDDIILGVSPRRSPSSGSVEEPSELERRAVTEDAVQTLSLIHI